MPFSDASLPGRESVLLLADLPVVLGVLSDHVVLLHRDENGEIREDTDTPLGSGHAEHAPRLLASVNRPTVEHACSAAEQQADKVTFAAEHVASGQSRVLECTVVPLFEHADAMDCALWVCSFRDVAADYFRLVLDQTSLPGIAGVLADALEAGSSDSDGPRDNFLELRWSPIREFRTGRVVNAVASYQWNHPRLGPLVPSAVLDIAQGAGLVPELNDWLLREVCAAAISWPDPPPNGAIGATIPLYPHGLDASSFVRSVMRALSASGLPPHRLTVDVEASRLASDDGVLPAVLAHVQALGVQLSVANFGRSLTSFHRTMEGPGTRTIRVSPGLTNGVASNPRRRAALSVLMESLRALGCHLAVQGVSVAEDEAVLRELGFDLCAGVAGEQRFDSDAFTRWLAEAPERPLHSPN